MIHWRYLLHDTNTDRHTRVLNVLGQLALDWGTKKIIIKIIYMYRVSQEEWTKLRESIPYVELYRYNPKHLYPKLNGYGDNGQRSLKL